MPPDAITIEGLRAITHVGVPDAERSSPQEVAISVRMVPAKPLAGLEDRIEATVDYYEVSKCLLKLAAARPRKLIETLAEDVAKMLLAEFALAEVDVEIRKFILPETEYVSVRIHRTRIEYSEGF